MSRWDCSVQPSAEPTTEKPYCLGGQVLRTSHRCLRAQFLPGVRSLSELPPGYPSQLYYLAAAACSVSRRYTSLRSSDSIQGEDSPPYTHRLRPSVGAGSSRATPHEHPSGAVLEMAAWCNQHITNSRLSPSQVEPLPNTP